METQANIILPSITSDGVNEDVYLLFHITKTGGTSIREMLLRHYRKNRQIVYPYYYEWENKILSRPFVLNESSANAKYFIGHLVYYGMHIPLGKPARYVIFLRDPLSRFVSLYNHILIENYKIGTPVDFKWWLDRYFRDTIVGELTDFYTPSLEKAKEIIKNTSFIGFQETFEEDVKQLFYPTVYITRQNITRLNVEGLGMGLDVVQFTDAEKEIVMRELVKDYELYNYALQLRAQGHNKEFRLPLWVGL